MRNKLLSMGFLILSVSVLSGCFGESEVVEEEKVKFTEDTALSREDKEELDNVYDKIVGSDNEDIKASDYIIRNIMSGHLEKDFFYGGILNMDIDQIYQQQLKYFEVHREYMMYLENKGASKEDLILNNRKFNFYLETFKGRQLEGKEHVKRVIEKIFYEYSVLELDTIMNGESITKLVTKERKKEKENGMWDWFREEDNANFKGDILVFTKVIFDLLEPSDKDVVVKFQDYIKNVDELVNQDLNTVKEETLKSNLKQILEKVKKEKVNDSVEWLKIKVQNHIIYEINNVSLYYNKKDFKLAEEKFFIDVNREEVLVTLSLIEEGLSQQDEKRKKLKEKIEKENEKEEK